MSPNIADIERVSDYCTGLLNHDKRIRKYSADQLGKLGEDSIPELEKIILSQINFETRNWNLLVGAVSTLNQYGYSHNEIVKIFQNNLLWLSEDKGRYDLHVHTELSDGTQTVEEVMTGAVSACVKVLSLCDHNTMDGVRLAQSIGKNVGIRVIPGCEFSTHMDLGIEEWIEVHIAGYNLSPDSEDAEELFMSTQRKIQMRDILVANDFLLETKKSGELGLRKNKSILDIIIEADNYYGKILSRNQLPKKSQEVLSKVREVESRQTEISKRLDSLIHNVSSSNSPYNFSADEESLMRKLILFSGYMIDHAMNQYYQQLSGEEFKGGNWFSEIKKRQEKFAKCLPKVDPKYVIDRIYDLGGIPVLSHPTWYSVLLLQKSRKRIQSETGKTVSRSQETQFRIDALTKGTEIIRRIDQMMPHGLQIMELYHWSYDTEFDLEPYFLSLASELGVSLSAASDFHGPKKYGEHRSKIGTGVDYNVLGTYDQIIKLDALIKNGKE